MLNVLTQVMILFALIAVGFICKKTQLISNNMNKDVSSLLVNITVPSLIIVSLNSLTFSQKLLLESLILFGISFFFYVFLVVISYLFAKIFRLEGSKKDIFQFSMVFGNTTFMGYPVANAVFGEEGLFFMAVCDVNSPIFMWTFGVFVMCRNKSRQEQDIIPIYSRIKQMVNPCIVAVAIGFLLLGTSLELPMMINDILHLLGSLTTPLAMIFIGSILGDMDVRLVFQDVRAILFCVQRLILLPLTVLIILKTLDFGGYLLKIPVLYASMPVAALTSILAAKYGNDYKVASQLVLVSTFLCIFTIPGVVWILLNL